MPQNTFRRRRAPRVRVSAAVALALCSTFAACALAAPLMSGVQLVPSGSKPTGGGEHGAQFGFSVAVSADGTTALVGAPNVHVQDGAVSFFAHSGSTWRQQGPTIVGSSQSSLGSSVALSANGNTALVDEGVGVGHVWVYTRAGSTWKRAAKIVGKGESDDSEFGQGLALSSDGNTALVGDPLAHGDSGEIWMFTRSGSTWKQTASFMSSAKESYFGQDVALSADGTTALVGWNGLHNFAGAAQLYTRSGATWKAAALLTGRGESAGNGFGTFVGLSGDGRTAFVVGQDFANPPKIWAFARSGSGWAQNQLKTDGTMVFNGLALSADGKTALVGARAVHAGAGTVFVYARAGSAWSLGNAALSVQEPGVGLGDSVAVSADGRVAVVGASEANHDAGAAWLFAAAR